MGLFLYSTYLFVIIAGRIWLQYKLTGDHGLRPANKKSSTLARVLSAFWIIALTAPLVVAALAAFGYIQPTYDFGVTGLVIGTMVGLAAIFLGFVAQLQMGKSWRIGVDEDEETELVTSGFFKYVKNPIYSTTFLLGIALVILIPHISMLLCLIFAYFTIDTQVRYIEEPYLKKLHGDNYDEAYARRVNRYIPNIFQNNVHG